MKEKLKIGIIGMGPVGMILAVKLKEAGCDVSVCDTDEFKIKKIKNEGIVLENIFSSTTRFENVFTSAKEMSSMDLDYLVFALKSYHTSSAAKETEALISEKLTVVSAQNGIDVEQLLFPVFGEEKTLRMVINFAGNLVAPNKVKVTFFNPPNYIGSVDDSRTHQSELLAEIMNQAGLTTKNINSFELQKSVWEKTILNSSLSALCGVGRLTMAEAMADADTIELIEQIINEGIDVAAKEKIFFPDDFLKKCMRYLKKGGDHFPSLAVDLIGNRQTEIDYFNGKFVEYGKKHYVRTSLNLAFTNTVKAMTNKNILLRVPGAVGDQNKKIISKGLIEKNKSSHYFKENNFFLGIDLGSAYSKFTVIDENGKLVFKFILQSVNKDKPAKKRLLQAIQAEFNIKKSCATGYGRKFFEEADMIKTEIHCAAAGVSHFFKGEKNIIDIGGEDIKITHTDSSNNVVNFYMNDKCAAGTGAFLTEIAERAQINISDMSALAAHSDYEKELNSFCTVFAKTEIMNWVFDGMPAQDIARGIYISIANKVAKLRINPAIPVIMIGGVISHHPYMKEILSEKIMKEIIVLDNPQFAVAFGAALLAMKNHFSSFFENCNP